MAEAQAAALRATAFLETKVDVLSANCVPVMDECAICLESYISEPATRITGVPGCTHIIGLSCLTSLLTTNPTQEKKCPICRTVWIPAPVPPNPRPGLSTMGGWESAVARAAARIGANANDVGGARTATLPSTRTPEMVINIDSDSDDEVTEESYQQYRQEIADIRSRARNGQLSRRQRREEGIARERNGGGNARSNQTASLFRAAFPTMSQSTRYRSPIDPIEALTARNWRNTSQNANANNDFPAPAPTRRNNDNDIAILAPEPAPAFSRLSPSPQTVDDDQVRILNERTKRVDEREEELRIWERRLNERERDLHKREQALFVREQRVAQRERKKDEFVEMKQRQLDELRAMALRHQEEARRA